MLGGIYNIVGDKLEITERKVLLFRLSDILKNKINEQT